LKYQRFARERLILPLEKKASPMSMVGFPLLLIPVAIYNIIAFLMPGVSLTEQAEPLFKVMLVSGVEWPVTLRDMLLALGVVMLMFEVIKGARPGAKYLMDHLLSLIVFGAAAAEFVLWPRFGTSTYFLLTLLALVDFLSGIALRTRRSAMVGSAPAISRKSVRKPEKIETPVAEPQFEPTPAQTTAPAPALAPAPVAAPATTTAVPAATSVAESVLQDHPAAPPAAAASSASASSAASASRPTSPEVPSPGLQPAASAPPSPDAPR
jgi:hypothetical protein